MLSSKIFSFKYERYILSWFYQKDNNVKKKLIKEKNIYRIFQYSVHPHRCVERSSWTWNNSDTLKGIFML